jgi:hypothetical protein
VPALRQARLETDSIRRRLAGSQIAQPSLSPGRGSGLSMNPPVANRGTLRQLAATIQYCGHLFRRYGCWLTAAVAVAFLATRTIESWMFDEGRKALLDRTQQQQAETAAARIELFVKDIEAQMSWLTQVPSNAVSPDDWHFESLRVLRQAPAITELTRIDATGREQVWVSRIAADVVGAQTDFSRDPKFVQAKASKRYYSPVYFRRESEPYMTLAVAGAGEDYGVAAAEVNLKLIWDVISEISVALQRTAFVIDGAGRLIAHPDMSLVLRNIDLSHLAYGPKPACNGIQPLTMCASIQSLGWTLILCRPKESPAAISGECPARSGPIDADRLCTEDLCRIGAIQKPGAGRAASALDG